MHHYLYSLDARTDNLFVVVFGAEWTRILALPQKVESATVARSLRAIPIKERGRRCENSHKSELRSSSIALTLRSKAEAGPREKIPRQRDDIFSSHCGVASQSDGCCPALFTSQGRLTGPEIIINRFNLCFFKKKNTVPNWVINHMHMDSIKFVLLKHGLKSISVKRQGCDLFT